MIVQNHPLIYPPPDMLDQLARRKKGEPNPFVVGKANYQKFVDVMEACTEVNIARRRQGNDQSAGDKITSGTTLQCARRAAAQQDESVEGEKQGCGACREHPRVRLEKSRRFAPQRHAQPRRAEITKHPRDQDQIGRAHV